MIMSARGAHPANLLEAARVVLSHHDFSKSLPQHLFLNAPMRQQREPDAPGGSSASWILTCSIDGDLALCIVPDAVRGSFAGGHEAFFLAVERIHRLFSTRTTGSPLVPPVPANGGQGATAEAGLAQYFPRKRHESS